MESLFLCAANNSNLITMWVLENSKCCCCPMKDLFCMRKTKRFFLQRAEPDGGSLPLRCLLVQNHITACPGGQQRGHAGVQLIFYISASRSTITQSVDPSVLCSHFHTVQRYRFPRNRATNKRTADQHHKQDPGRHLFYCRFPPRASPRL